jgi:topoisomerase-4 subunit A
MATDIPSHNLSEVAQATMLLLDKPNATLDEVLQVLPAPDLPTEAEIISPASELRKIYATGRGSFKMRATWEVEKSKEGTAIVIKALPYQVSMAAIIEQIAKQIQDKKLPLVDDVRDESDKENPTRLVIVPRSNRVDTDALMDHLFATTLLEKSYKINLNMLGLDGKPAVKSLLQILNEWLEFRRLTVTHRLQYRLEKILARLHILQGLLTAYLNIDEVIEIVRNEDKPKEALMSRFNLSAEQAEAILNLRLRQLAKLEEFELKAEENELEKERNEIETVLGSDKLLNRLIKKEIQADMKTYGDARRSPLVEREKAKALDQTEITPVEDVTVILSEKGWIRCAKGHDIDPTTLTYRAGDNFLAYARGKSNQPVVFIDDTGRAYTLDAATLPSARGQGEAISSKITLPAGANIVQVLMANDEQKILLASDAGYGFICQFSDLVSRNKAGKAAITLPENAKVLQPQLMNQDNALLVAMSSVGRMLVFPASELPQLAKGKGNKIINISASAAKERSELLVRLLLIQPEQSLEFISGKRKIKLSPTDIEKYRGERARKGAQLVRGLNINTEVKIID